MTDTGRDRDGTAHTSLGRRAVLASAAAAAAVGAVPASPPAQAAPRGRGTAARSGSGSVRDLLAVAGADRDLDWIKASLQSAVELELSTIPPYLCGWWSVKDRGSEAARLIRRIIDDEMYHMGVVCNLLVAVGGRPRIRDAAPAYPGPLPGGVRPELTVYLSGLTRSVVHDVMMAIEAPENPLALGDGAVPSVGAFYGELLEAFRTVSPRLLSLGQLSERIGTDDLKPVRTLDDVERSIGIVKEQGEGTAASPADAFQDDHPAHYYAFGEIYHGRRLRKTGGTWDFTGAPVPFPDVRPMGRVPAGGWPHPPEHVGRLLDRFDATYHAVLQSLESAWEGHGARSLGAAVHAMRGLEATAVELMETPVPGSAGTYGPQFRPSAPEPDALGRTH